MSQIDSRQLVGVGASSGAVWFALAMLFDKGVRDFNTPVIPSSGLLPLTLSLLGGIVAGVVVTLTLGRALLAPSRLTFWLAPLGSLVVGVITFSLTTWVVWLLVGAPSSHGSFGQLAQILATFVIYGLMSPIFTPLLYALAHLNQFAMRWALGARNLTRA
jgi:hypothetical protein